MSQIVVGANQKVHFVPPVAQFVGSAYQGEILGMYWVTSERQQGWGDGTGYSK
jgi:hypothetical protein